MEFKEYLRVIRKRLWLVIILTALAGLISGGISIYFLPKIYQATTALIVSNHKNNVSLDNLQYDDLLVNQKLVKTYSVIARSDRVLELVIEDLNLALTIEELRMKISVDSEAETEILQISVDDENPEQAMHIANSIAGIFKEQVKGVLQMENVQIIDVAKLPAEPMSPREIPNALIAAFLGLVLALGIIFMIEYLDNTIKQSEEIEKNTGLITLGVIPDLKTPAIEAYKTLRTNVQYAAFEKRMRSILITSSNPQEGKSITAANLAKMMAKSELMILLIDCDLRRPTLHKWFDLTNNEGMTNVLTQDIDYKNIVNLTGMSNLHIITSGPIPPNPPELLGSSKMKDFLRKVMEVYDAVIIDSPPVGLFTDAAVLSRLIDGIVLVVRYGKSTFNELGKTRDSLNKVNANILGVVVNRAPKKKIKNKYY